MALSTWFSKLIPGQASSTDVEKTKAPIQPVATTALQSLREELSAMRAVAAPWSTSAPPSTSPSDSRAWLLQEATALSADASGSPSIVQFAEQLTATLNLPDLALPPSPTTSLQLFSLLSDEKVSIHSIQEVIKQDPALLKLVWLKANSAHFATPPKDIQYAIARVGLHDLGRLAASAVVSSRAFQTQTYRALSKTIRERCLVTSELIQRYGQGQRSNTFLCGLLHGVGSFIVLRSVQQESEALSQAMPRILSHFEAPLGLLALSRWRLPKSVVYSVGYQAAASHAPLPHQALASLCRATSVAVHGAQGMMRGHNIGALEVLEESLKERSIAPEKLLYDAKTLLERHRARQ